MDSITPASYPVDRISPSRHSTISLFMRSNASVGDLREHQYRFMRSAFDRTGGLICGDEAAHRLGRSCDQPISKLARWIVDQTIVSLEWHSGIHVPMFQFEARAMAPRESVLQVVRELREVFDGWQSALWFTTPNYWLGGCVPLEQIHRDPIGVIEAARADRFLIKE